MNFQDFQKKYQKKEPKEYQDHVNSHPVVSVLVQTYQHEKYIKDCLDGILQQRTSFPFEIILGEDCSSDGTRKFCIEYAEKFPEKIRLFLHQPENKIRILGIPTGNFNALYNFFSARGEFIAFCEGDDVWTDPLKLQKQVAHLKSHSSLAFTYHSYLETNEKLQPLSKEKCLEQPKKNITKEDLQRLIFHPLLSTICFRNSFQEIIPKEMAEVLNVDSFLISLLGNYGEAGFLKDLEPSFYRRHEGGIWSRKRKKVKMDSKLLTYQKLRDFYLGQGKKDLSTFFQRRIISIWKMQVLYYLRRGNFIRTTENLRKLL